VENQISTYTRTYFSLTEIPQTEVCGVSKLDLKAVVRRYCSTIALLLRARLTALIAPQIGRVLKLTRLPSGVSQIWVSTFRRLYFEPHPTPVGCIPNAVYQSDRVCRSRMLAVRVPSALLIHDIICSIYYSTERQRCAPQDSQISEVVCQGMSRYIRTLRCHGFKSDN
jgi:hypothetical protein